MADNQTNENKNVFKDTILPKTKEIAIKVWKWIKKISIKFWEWIKTRWIGFFLLIPVAILSFIIPFVYGDGFLETIYGDWGVLIIPFFATLSIIPALFRPTARYAPILMFFFNLLFLLLFIYTAYMYLSTPFFNGIQGNVLVQAGFPFSFCCLASVINMFICAVAACFRQFRQEKSFFGAFKTLEDKPEEVGGATNE